MARDKRQDTTERNDAKSDWLVRFANRLVAAVFVLVPFHAFLTVWGSSVIGGGYDALRLWTVVALGLLLVIVAWWLLQEKRLRTWFGRNFLVRVAGVYILMSLLLAIIGFASGNVSAKAMGIGLFLNTRFVLFFVLVMVVVHKSTWLQGHWKSLVLIPGLVVAIFAVLQYLVLPINFLSYFGYGADTIPAYSTINSNHEYIRVSSTLRGPNPLGAYLVLLISALAVSLRGFNIVAVVRRGLYLVLASMALLFSFSRSAWLGVVVAMIVFGFLLATSRRLRLILAVVLLGFGLVSAGAYYIAQENRGVQNAIFHTDDDSKVAISSNESRLQAQERALQLVSENPFGLGPGSAGPASVYNQQQTAVISENYFLQIAIETGWPGLLLFVFLLVLVTTQLFAMRQKSLAMVLLMSLAGLTLVNLLSHAWTDETIAFTWWGLLGIALGTAVGPVKRRKLHHA